MMQSDVAVIGAGAAGLAAAMALTRAGARATLYERASVPGGRMRTATVDGARVDVGVQLVSGAQHSLFELAREAGASALLQKSPGRDALWRNDRAHPITYGSVASMATSSALPALLKLKLAGRYLPFLSSHARALDANDPAHTGGIEHDHESIAAWGTRELGADFVELLVYPLLAAYYGAAPENVSAGVYHALARMGMDVSVFGVTGGFGALADAWLTAATNAGATIHTNTVVTGIDVSDDGVRIHTAEGFATHDAAILAVPAPRAAALLGGPGTGSGTGPAHGQSDADAHSVISAELARVTMQPTITFAFIMEREFPGDYFGLSFPRGAAPGGTIAAVCVQSRKLPGLVPAGGDVLVALPAPTATRSLLAMDDAAAINVMTAALDRAVSGLSKRIRSAHVTRFDDGYTIFGPGHLQWIESFDHDVLPTRVEVAGDYLVAPSVEGAVRSGLEAAGRVLRKG